MLPNYIKLSLVLRENLTTPLPEFWDPKPLEDSGIALAPTLSHSPVPFNLKAGLFGSQGEHLPPSILNSFNSPREATSMAE